MIEAAETQTGRKRRTADFPRLVEALDYAAHGRGGLTFYGSRGRVEDVVRWPDLQARATATAGRLRSRGLAPGDRVAILAETSGGFVEVLLACMAAGLAPCPTPLPVAFGSREDYTEHLGRMIEAVSCRAVVAPDAFADWVTEGLGDRGLVFAGGLAELDGAPDALPSGAVDEDEIAYVQFTSGTTGGPKGVEVTHRALMENIRAMAVGLGGVGDDDRGAFWLPFYHDMGLVGALMLPIACQASVDLMSTRTFTMRPGLWTEIMSRNRSTMSFAPSFGYDLAARRAKASGDLDLSSWRVAGVGGDMVHPRALSDFAERFASAGFRPEAFMPSYGMAEACLGLCFSASDRPPVFERVDADRLVATGEAAPASDAARSAELARCGPPLPGNRIEIRDEDDAPLPERRVGRIMASGPSLMRGYAGAPEETASVLGADGWLDTGDLGYLVDGELVITGRAKDMIAINGRNIWPGEVEISLQDAVEGLRASGVGVLRDPDALSDIDVARVTIVLECRTKDAEERERLAKEALSVVRERHGLVADVVLCGPRQLPRTTSGKLRRAEARRMLKAGELTG